MHITRFKDASECVAPEHDDMTCLRLQGKEAGPPDTLWLGTSRILPGGHTSLSPSPIEKIYLVEGELTIETAEGVAKLRTLDSCRIAPGESRALKNATGELAVTPSRKPNP